MASSFGTWFLVLLAVVIAAPYVLRVPPKSRRQWMYLAVAVAFVGWLLLPLVRPLRAQAADVSRVSSTATGS
jgi:hypothetical protein